MTRRSNTSARTLTPKCWILLGILAIASPAAAADPPLSMSFQGMLRTASGAPVNATLSIKVSLYDDDLVGTQVHTQTFSNQVVTNGVFDVELGPLTMNLVDLAPELWVETQVVGESPLPRRPLLSVPFALRARSAQLADVAKGLACSGCLNDTHVGPNTITGANIKDGSIGSTDVSFPWAEGDGKGGAATKLVCPGCVDASDIANNAVGTNQIQNGSVSKDDVAFNYADSDSKGGPAKSLGCTNCITSEQLVSNLTLRGNVTIDGSLQACKDNATGCNVRVSDDGGFYDQNDGYINLQVTQGMRVRNQANTGWTGIESGSSTVNGNATVTGSVGVGTSSPGKSLHVNGTGVRISRGGAADLGSIDLIVDNAPTASSLKVVPVGSTQTPDVTFYRGDGQPALHVETSNGRLGVGTTAPGAEVDVVGHAMARNSGGTTEARLSSDGAVEIARSSTPYVDFKSTPSEDYDVRLSAVGDGLAVTTGGNGSASERVRVTASGAVGINTTDPTAVLDVNGSARIRGDVSVDNHKIVNAYIPLGRHNEGGYNVVGYHYESLIAADKRFSVTASPGAISGAVSSMFDGVGNSALIYPQSGGAAVIEINMGMQHYWHAVSVYFPYGRSVSGIKIEKYYDPNSGNDWSCSDPAATWATVAETTSFTGSDFFSASNLGNGICKFRFTFTGTTATEGNFRLGELAAWRQAHYGDDGLYVTRTGAGGNRIFSDVKIDGQLKVDGGVDLGDGANDELTAANVETLTGGGSADSLHTHASASAPKGWKSIGDLDGIFSLIGTYPMADYQYGVRYNHVLGQVHEIVCSSWNKGYRCITEPYLIGDYESQYAYGGAAWFYDNYDSWDDACTNSGHWTHKYYALGTGSGWAGGITWLGGNGCSIPELLIRPR